MFPFASAGGRPPGFYQIDRSLRFNDDDSAYLSRTPGSAGNRKTWTLDIWCKRGNLGTTQYLWSAGAASTDYTAVFFDTNNKLNVIRVASSTTDAQKVSTALYRDPSAWYNVTVKMDAANTNLDVYVNGVEITAWDTNNEPSNIDGAECNTVLHTIGARSYTQAGTYFDGYIAYAHFLDGTASAPFTGGLDVDGIWRPEAVSASYGTTGWYLSFADNTSTTTLGYDDAGSNDWTLNNFSVTAGANNDSLEDTPTNNWSVWNTLYKGSNITLSDGNLKAVKATASTNDGLWSSIGVASGKWYWEIKPTSITQILAIGAGRGPQSGASPSAYDPTAYWYISTNGNAQNRNTSATIAYGASYTNNDVIGVALDLDSGKIFFSKNGTWQNSGDPAAGSNPAFSDLGSYPGAYNSYILCDDVSNAYTLEANFGQRPFAYTPPTGFSALCTANLPTPDIANPGDYMNAVLYTGTGSSLGVTGVGFQPDLVWIKSRSAATDHALYDSTRGVQNQLESNTTTDETTEATGLTAFGSDGFTVGALAQVNTSAATYVGWCWREGVTPGFDIVTYTGTGVARTISHNLGTVPKLIIVKARSTASTDQGWPVYHASNTTAPETDYLLLNSSAATADLNTVWNDTAPTTTVFSVGTNALVNALNDTYVAYLFAEVEGFSKFGSYTGNGSADGPFVWCNLQPRYVAIKRTNTTGDWFIWDAARDTYNVATKELLANSTAVEAGTADLDILSNGFKLRATTAGFNASGATYIFAAFASQPFSAPANAR